MSQEKPIKISETSKWLKVYAVLVLTGLGGAEYVFDVMAKPVPAWVYFGLIGIMVGVDAKDIKELIMTMLKSIANKQ